MQLSHRLYEGLSQRCDRQMRMIPCFFFVRTSEASDPSRWVVGMQQFHHLFEGLSWKKLHMSMTCSTVVSLFRGDLHEQLQKYELDAHRNFVGVCFGGCNLQTPLVFRSGLWTCSSRGLQRPPFFNTLFLLRLSEGHGLQ